MWRLRSSQEASWQSQSLGTRGGRPEPLPPTASVHPGQPPLSSAGSRDPDRPRSAFQLPGAGRGAASPTRPQRSRKARVLSACCIPSPDYRLGKPGTPTLPSGQHQAGLGQGFQLPSDVQHCRPGRSGPGSQACEEKQAVHTAPLADPRVTRMRAQAHPPRPACAHTLTALHCNSAPAGAPPRGPQGSWGPAPARLWPHSGRWEASLGLCPFLPCGYRKSTGLNSPEMPDSQEELR